MANDDADYSEWIKTDPPPDLQELIQRAGQRRAEQLGQRFDPKNPAHGGYPHITADEWTEYDLAMKEWQTRRRDRLK